MLITYNEKEHNALVKNMDLESRLPAFPQLGGLIKVLVLTEP